jgi:rhodanese-related sulfurtransferase
LFAGCGRVEFKAVIDFPAREAPNYHGLVSASWVKGLLDYQQSGFQTPRPATYRAQRFVILEASWATLQKTKDYRNGHLPGAIHFNTDDLEDGSPHWRLREADELQRAIGRAGITPDTTVIVYGKKLIAAARVWWALKYAGVDDVRLLDGGLQAWSKAGYPVEREIQLPQPVEFTAPVASKLLATTAPFSTSNAMAAWDRRRRFSRTGGSRASFRQRKVGGSSGKWFFIVEAAGDRVSRSSMPGCWASRTSETTLMAGAVGARSIRPIRRRRAAPRDGGSNPPAIPWKLERHDHAGRR